MRKLLTPMLIAALGMIGAPALADKYVIDTRGSHASINFKVNHLGFSWLTGRFNQFTGEFTYNPENLEASSIRVEIDTTSVDSNHAERDRHLRSDDFLHVSQYPKATFVSTAINPAEDGKFEVVGDLTLHGQTNSITIKAKKIGAGTDPWGGVRVGFEGRTSFRMKDFGMDYDLGEASEIVYLDLHIEGIKQ